jgi:transcriptional repressor NrdR
MALSSPDRWRYGRGAMRCPACSSLDDRVVDSRLAEDGSAIRRRRECLGCGRRFTTYERFEELALTVIKRSGQPQPFDRAKIVAGVRAAAKNRPIGEEQLDALAVDIEESLRLEGQDVTSEQVGRAVLEQLRALDEVAYVRFASVYKGFSDAGDFEREVGLLAQLADPDGPSPN